MKKVLDFIVKNKIIVSAFIGVFLDIRYGILDHYFIPEAANTIRFIGMLVFGDRYTSPYNKKIIIEKFVDGMKNKK